MAEQNLYTIQLLNDLHNHFPDILYGRPGRFQNVEDILEYIRRVANISPYQRGLHRYNANNNPRFPPGISRNTPSQWEIITDNPEVSYSRMYIPLNGDISNRNISPINSIFSNILNQLINGDINNDEELENVVVRPTNSEIANATTVYRANSLQEDICTICQDNIELNEVRRITRCGHYFHRVCIDVWFQGNVHCPTCRHDIRETVNT